MANEVKILLTAQDRASAALKGIKGNVEGLQSKLLGLAVAAGATATAFISINTVKDAIRSTQELGSAVSELTRKTGLSAEKSSDYIYAAKAMGLTADQLSTTFGILEKRLTGVQDGTDDLAASTGPIAPILADMGIQVLDASGNIRPMADLIPEIADAFAGMTDPVQRAGRASQLFGRSGMDLLPFLNLGSKGLEELSAEARKLGLELSGSNVAQIRAYTLAQRKLGEALGGLKLVIGLAVMPVLTRFMEKLSALQPVIRDKLGKSIQWVTTVFRTFWTYLKYVVKTGDSLNDYLKESHTPLAAFLLLVGETVLSLKDIAEWFLKVADAAREWGQKIGGLLSDGRSMADNFSRLGDIIPTVAKAIAGLIAAMVVGTVLGFVAAIADFAIGIITFPFGVLKDIVGAVGDLVSITAKVVSKAITITQNVIRTGAAIIEFLADVIGTVFQNVIRTGAKIIDVLNPVTGTVTQSVQLQAPSGAGEGTKSWFANLFGNILGGLGGSPEVLRGISKFLGLLGAAIGGGIVVAVTGGITAAGVGTALVAAIALPIGVAFATYLAIIAELPVILTVALIRHFGGAIKTFFGETLPRLFTKAIPQFVKSLPRWAGALAGFVSGALTFALLGIPALLITRVAPAFAEAIGGIVQKIGGVFAGLGGLIGGWITKGLSGIGDIAGGIVAALASLPGRLADALKSIPGLLAQVPGWIAEAFVSIPGIVLDISTAFIDFATNLPGWIGAAFGAIPGIVSSFLTGVGGMVGIVVGALGDVIGAIMATPIGRAITWTMDQVVEGFKSGWKRVDDLTGGALNDLVKKAKDILGGIWDAFNGLLDPIQWVIDRIYNLIEAIGRIPTPPGWALAIAGGPIGIAAGIAKLFTGKAAGGLASGLTVVGEKGPELLNLPRGSHIYSNAESRQMAGGVTNNVEIHMNVTASGEDVEGKVFRALDKALRRAGFGGSSISAGAFVPS